MKLNQSNLINYVDNWILMGKQKDLYIKKITFKLFLIISVYTKSQDNKDDNIHFYSEDKNKSYNMVVS